MRFYDQLLSHYQTYSHVPGTGEKERNERFVSQRIASLLAASDTKRILFDSRQAAVFASLGERPPTQVQEMLRPPFTQFFLELDQPILLGVSYESELALTPESWKPGLVVGPQDAPSDNNLCGILFKGFDDDNGWAQVLMYFTSEDWNPGDGMGYFDARVFLLDLTSGFPCCSAKTLRDEGLRDPLLLPDDVTNDEFGRLGDDKDWSVCPWASNMQLYGGLVDWVLTYMVAKGVRITEEPLSRQQRRALERKGLPNPWHIVTVEPRFSDGEASGTGQGRRHGYRYDVMGHLRRERHKLRDGSYREKVEWVRPHQRGLNYQTYVPKTSRFAAGKVEDERMAEIYDVEAKK